MSNIISQFDKKKDLVTLFFNKPRLLAVPKGLSSCKNYKEKSLVFSLKYAFKIFAL